MPHEPKKRHSRQRQGKRRAAIKLELPNLTTCPNCSAQVPFHTVCQECGYYKGVQIVTKKESTKATA